MAKANLEIIISAKDQASKVLGGIGSALGTIGGLALTVGTAGLAAAGAGLAAVGGGILALSKDAAKLGPIEDAFKGVANTGLLGADAMLTALREQSNQLISDTELMKSYNTAAQLVGIQFADQLPGAMQYLGKVAGATGQDMGYMMDSLVRGVGRLSPMILDNLGIQVDLTSANEAYAASLGLVASDLTKTQQQTALMNQVMMKLAENTANMPEMSDPFKQIMVTLTNLKDMLAKTIGPVILPLIQQLADQLTTFVQSDEFQVWLKQISDWLVTNLVPAIERFFNWVAVQLPPAIKAFSEWWKGELMPALKAAWDYFNANILPMLQQIGSFLGKILPPLINAFVQGWKLVFQVLGFVGTAITNTVNGLKTLVTWIQTAITKLTGLQLPDWLTPGSPTPLELGIRGITDAMGQLAHRGLPQMSAGLGGMGYAAAPASGSGAVIINVHYSPAMSLGNRAEFETQLAPILDNVMRRVSRGQIR